MVQVNEAKTTGFRIRVSPINIGNELTQWLRREIMPRTAIRMEKVVALATQMFWHVPFRSQNALSITGRSMSSQLP